ncbi:MAG TPA: fused MFS/spermidine synthase [Thermoanaerobaculia bacterium]|nr:fused MFS/spermidine synthase [Thermoanaerobaculia bacterium]
MFAGAILMSLEVLGFRIIGKTFGSALRETSVVISVCLTAMSIGYFAGGRAADRFPRLRTLLLALACAGATTALVPWLDDLVSDRVFASSIPLPLHSAIVTIALFFVPILFLASVSPIAIRLIATRVEKSGTTAGSISAVSTFGSILGSVCTGFFLIDLFESVHRTVYALAMLTWVLAGLTLAAHLMTGEKLGRLWFEQRFRFVSALALGGLSVVTVLSLWFAGPSSAFRGPVDYGNEVLLVRDSSFHHIQVVDHNRFRTLLFDRTYQSRMNLDDPAGAGFDYIHYFHVPMILNPSAKRVLFIGLGGGSAPKQFLHAYPEVIIDAVDIDPLVLEVAKQYFFVEEGPRLRLHVEDGRAFVKRSAEKYDIIAIDAYTTNRYGATIPAHLATREFFRECAGQLTENGMIVYNVAAPAEEEITRAMSKTLYRAFPYQLAFSPGNTVFVASARDIRKSGTELSERAASLRSEGKIRLEGLEEKVALGSTPINVTGVPILTDDYAPVDQLMRRLSDFTNTGH